MKTRCDTCQNKGMEDCCYCMHNPNHVQSDIFDIKDRYRKKVLQVKVKLMPTKIKTRTSMFQRKVRP